MFSGILIVGLRNHLIVSDGPGATLVSPSLSEASRTLPLDNLGTLPLARIDMYHESSEPEDSSAVIKRLSFKRGLLFSEGTRSLEPCWKITRNVSSKTARFYRKRRK